MAGNYVNYGYDALGQLTNAVGHESGGAARLQEQWGYQYDLAGNLVQRAQNQLNQAFAVNNTRNQLDSVSASGSLTVAGITKPVATAVTVNQQAAALYADKTFAATVPLTTTTITAVASDAQGHSASNTVSVSLAAPTNPQYDLNGNLKTDGRRIFTFDTENQLVSVVVTNNATNSTQSGFVYDGKSRRRIRTEAKWGGTAWITNQVVRYLYDGNRVLQERDGTNNVLVTYTRGLDLSQSLEGAGGIGGLLARTHPGNHHFYYHSDGNGNVTAIMNQNQTLVAQYHYDPFGNLIAQSGPLAEGNLYRFSSKEFHQASGLYYYGYRFYDPNLQRWLNRDPIGEVGGVNLYGFVGNDPINRGDPDGRIVWLIPFILGGAAVAALSTPATVNAPGPNDPVYPPYDPGEIAGNAFYGGLFGGLFGAGGKALTKGPSPKKCPPPPQTGTKLGGAYDEIPANSGQVHHIPPDSVSTLPKGEGPAIWMETSDHLLTASHGSQGLAGAEFRAQQAALIEQGRFAEAMQMDIADIRSKFGVKYDVHIEAMQNYYKTIPEWKLKLGD